MNARAVSRYEVMLDLTLTPNARILYFLIDDKAGESGEMWWHWRKLAVLLGVGKGRYFFLVDELTKAGLIAIRREKRRIYYSVLKTGPKVENQSGKQDRSVLKTGPEHLNMNLRSEPEFANAQSQPRKTTCDVCSGTGWRSEERPYTGKGVHMGATYEVAVICECRRAA